MYVYNVSYNIACFSNMNICKGYMSDNNVYMKQPEELQINLNLVMTQR